MLVSYLKNNNAMELLNQFLNLPNWQIFFILWAATGFVLATVRLVRMPDLFSDEEVPFVCWLGMYAMYIKAPWIDLFAALLGWIIDRQEKKRRFAQAAA